MSVLCVRRVVVLDTHTHSNSTVLCIQWILLVHNIRRALCALRFEQNQSDHSSQSYLHPYQSNTEIIITDNFASVSQPFIQNTAITFSISFNIFPLYSPTRTPQTLKAATTVNGVANFPPRRNGNVINIIAPIQMDWKRCQQFSDTLDECVSAPVSRVSSFTGCILYWTDSSRWMVKNGIVIMILRTNLSKL